MILTLLIAILALAGSPEWETVTESEKAEVLSKAAQAGARDVSADFVMERHSPLIDQVMTTSGHMSLKGRKVLEWTAGDRKDVIAMRNIDLSDTNAVKTTVEKDGDRYLITVFPVRKTLKNAFSKVVIEATADLVPESVKIETASGDWTLLIFKNVRYA